jgi:uncharacterized protein (DUF427 family)
MSHPEIKEPNAGHPITIEPTKGRVQVRVNGELIADTTSALVLQEATLPAVQYIPLADVASDRLSRTDTHTYCPFKGTASYWSLPDAADLVWSYPEPKPEVAEIKDHLCFYEVEVS